MALSDIGGTMWTVDNPLIAADIGSMTYGELETFEDIVGVVPEDEAQLEKAPRAKLMLALGFIAAGRVKPGITLDEVRALPLGAIKFVNEEDEAEGND